MREREREHSCDALYHTLIHTQTQTHTAEDEPGSASNDCLSFLLSLSHALTLSSSSSLRFCNHTYTYRHTEGQAQYVSHFHHSFKKKKSSLSLLFRLCVPHHSQGERERRDHTAAAVPSPVRSSWGHTTGSTHTHSRTHTHTHYTDTAPHIKMKSS